MPRSRPAGRRQPRAVTGSLLSLGLALVLGACSSASAGGAGTAAAGAGGAGPIRVGAVFPLDGMTATLAGQERLGVQLAADFVNADGGIQGRPVALDVRDLSDRAAAGQVIDSLRVEGASVVVGAYSSDLSIAVSSAAAADGLVYWEAGAVADQLTGRGLPLVFRVGTDGGHLGANSATFAATVLAPRLGKVPSALRLTLVGADDPYARSVADGTARAAGDLGLVLADRIEYHLSYPDWPTVLQRVAASRPDVVVLASHIPDGVAFRRAMLAAHLHVGSLIGSTMAECGPDFGDELGADAVGVFASDRPTQGFNPDALSQTARAVYDRFAAAWRQRTGGPPTEEAIAGFSAGWALFHDVLPGASGARDPQAIAAAARSLDLPDGALPNGAGLRFSADPGRLGQNERASAVIWQWQGVRRSVTVWPPVLATGAVTLVPLTR